MNDVFFSATKKALNNLTSTFDTVWPTAVGLWNLRCMVNGVKKEYPTITEAELAAKFGNGSGIRGVNYKRVFMESSWDQQQINFAWVILNNTISIFEGWLEDLKNTIFPNMKIKNLQFPEDVQSEIKRLTSNSSPVLKNSFYAAYLGKRDRCYGKIEALMYCYRVFKETRNCYMHNGSKADSKLVEAYSKYLQYANTTSLGVSEVPEFIAPILNNYIQISLRGIVGFSYILIKIIVSLDTELICSVDAETEFLSRYQSKHTIMRTIKPDPAGARKQVSQYVKQCCFPSPHDIDEVTEFLLRHHLISR